MKTSDPLRTLRFQVRALWCTALVFGCMAAANVRTVHVSNADNTPDTDINLSGPRWTGTLDAARLPADPVAGMGIAPASVDAAGSIQTGTYFATDSGGFVASDTGVYVGGQQIADNAGVMVAADHLATPAVYVETIQFFPSGQLFSDGGQLIWTDPYGGTHVVAFNP